MKSITKSQLKEIVSESIRYKTESDKIRENLWTIAKASHALTKLLKYADEPDHENQHDSTYDFEVDLYQWAKKVDNEADDFLTYQYHM